MNRLIDYLITWVVLILTLPIGVICLVVDFSMRNKESSFDWKRYFKYLADGNFLSDNEPS